MTFLQGEKIETFNNFQYTVPGVPISDAVAGVACGLVTSSDSDGDIGEYKLITDILVSAVIGHSFQLNTNNDRFFP